MQDNLSKFDTLKLATQYWQGDSTTTTLIVVLFFLALAIFFITGFLLQKQLKTKRLKKYFETFAKERGLMPQQIQILWHYSQQMEQDPVLVLEFKAPFEKVVDLYVHADPHPDEKLVRDMRKKLGFEIQSPYIPLTTTKDIEIFQNGRMIFANNQAINVALYDKDERHMYWLSVDEDLPISIHPGEVVKMVFVRQDDGIYSFEQPITEIVKESGKTIIKIPHTFDLNRIQRREYPRIKLDLPIRLSIITPEGPMSIQGQFKDLSAGGARICVQKSLEGLKKIKYGDEVGLSFVLDNVQLQLQAKVLERNIKPKTICLRTLFENIDEKTKDQILEYVQKEQLKIAQLQKNR